MFVERKAGEGRRGEEKRKEMEIEYTSRSVVKVCR